MNEPGAAKEYLGGKILACTRRSPGIDESHCRGAKRFDFSPHRGDARSHGVHAGTAMKNPHPAEGAFKGIAGKTARGSRMPESPFGCGHPRERLLRRALPRGTLAGSRKLREKERDTRRPRGDRRAGPL